MLVLFNKEGCPYCAKVRAFMSENGVSFVSVASETSSPSRKILEKLGGKMQVPFLVDFDRGEMMYESDDIIDYIKSL